MSFPPPVHQHLLCAPLRSAFRLGTASVLAAAAVACGGGTAEPAGERRASAQRAPEAATCGDCSPVRYRLKPEAAARVHLTALAPARPTASPSFKVSAPGATFQAWPRAARLADGGVVIAWHALGQGLCSRVYEAGGASRNSPSCVESPNAQAERPALAALAAGGYVIGWSVSLGNNTWSLRSQRYDATGAPIAGIQAIGTAAGRNPTQVTAAGLRGGGYVIGWQGQQYPANANIYARRFADDGTPVGSEFQVNSPDGGSAGTNMPGVAALAGGGFVFVWNGGGARAYARQFSPAGLAAGADRLVTPRAPFPFQPVAVAGLAGGGYVVAWNAGGAVDFQRFALGGAAMGEPTRVEPLPAVDPNVICGATPQGPTPCGYRQDLPDVAALDDGGFVVAYEYQGLPSSDDAKVIHGRRFGASGAAAGPAIRISDPATVVAKAASRPAVAPTGTSGLIAAWQYQSSEMAIFARASSGASLRASRR